MSKKLVFDTLIYAKMLENGGVNYSDAHADSLRNALSHNLYVKYEVDEMIKETMREIEKNRQADNLRLEQTIRHVEKEIHRSMYRSIVLLGSITTVLNALQLFGHWLIR